MRLITGHVMDLERVVTVAEGMVDAIGNADRLGQYFHLDDIAVLRLRHAIQLARASEPLPCRRQPHGRTK